MGLWLPGFCRIRHVKRRVEGNIQQWLFILGTMQGSMHRNFRSFDDLVSSSVCSTTDIHNQSIPDALAQQSSLSSPFSPSYKLDG